MSVFATDKPPPPLSAILSTKLTDEYRYILVGMREPKSPIYRDVPPLNGLRAFEAAARHMSVVRAADELHVTHGAVSRQIKQLEAQLDIQLFERRNRAVFLTPHGSVLFEACSEAMSRLGHAIRQIKSRSGDEQKRPLVVSCEPTIAMRWLIPRLATFAERHPDQLIHLLTAGGKVDFARDKVDVALRRNDFTVNDSHHVESIAPELMGPVCAPMHASSLLTHGNDRPLTTLHSRSRPSAWKRWQSVRETSFTLCGEQHFEHFYLSLQAASAGLGVAIGSAYMVEDDLRDQRLVAPLGFMADGSEYILLSPVAFADDPRRLLFLDWIRHEMAKSRHEVEMRGYANQPESAQATA